MKRLAMGLFFMIILAGCQEEVKSVEYYAEHHDERREVIEGCENSGSESKNCKNARAAIWKASSESSSMPSID